MKKVFVSLLVLLLLFSCEKIRRLTEFNIDYDTFVVVPSSMGLNLPFNINSPDIETNSESTFEINDTRKDYVKSIFLNNLKLSLISPTNANFNFLKSIKIFISAQGLPEILLASKENIDQSSLKQIELETENADFKNYIIKDHFSLRLQTVTREIITSDHEIKLNSSFKVKAKLRKK